MVAYDFGELDEMGLIACQQIVNADIFGLIMNGCQPDERVGDHVGDRHTLILLSSKKSKQLNRTSTYLKANDSAPLGLGTNAQKATHDMSGVRPGCNGVNCAN